MSKIWDKFYEQKFPWKCNEFVGINQGRSVSRRVSRKVVLNRKKIPSLAQKLEKGDGRVCAPEFF